MERMRGSNYVRTCRGPRSRRADHWSAALAFIYYAPPVHLAVPWKAYRAVEGSPLPAGVGRLCLPVGGGGSVLPAVRNWKGRHGFGAETDEGSRRRRVGFWRLHGYSHRTPVFAVGAAACPRPPEKRKSRRETGGSYPPFCFRREKRESPANRAPRAKLRGKKTLNPVGCPVT